MGVSGDGGCLIYWLLVLTGNSLDIDDLGDDLLIKVSIYSIFDVQLSLPVKMMTDRVND